MFFLGTDTPRCASVAQDYATLGWNTPMGKADDFDIVDRLVEEAPVASVFCLEPDDGVAVADLTQRLMGDERFQRPLMVYLDGGAEQVERIKAVCPFGVFVTTAELAWVLKRLLPKN